MFFFTLKNTEVVGRGARQSATRVNIPFFSSLEGIGNDIG